MSVYHGISPDGETVFLESGNINLRCHCIFKTSIKGKHYRFLVLEQNFGDLKKGLSMGMVFLDEGLAPGEYRRLTPEEVLCLKNSSPH